jgi:hypothetical protein
VGSVPNVTGVFNKFQYFQPHYSTEVGTARNGQKDGRKEGKGKMREGRERRERK